MVITSEMALEQSKWILFFFVDVYNLATNVFIYRLKMVILRLQRITSRPNMVWFVIVFFYLVHLFVIFFSFCISSLCDDASATASDFMKISLFLVCQTLTHSNTHTAHQYRHRLLLLFHFLYYSLGMFYSLLTQLFSIDHLMLQKIFWQRNVLRFFFLSSLCLLTFSTSFFLWMPCVKSVGIVHMAEAKEREKESEWKMALVCGNY